MHTTPADHNHCTTWTYNPSENTGMYISPVWLWPTEHTSSSLIIWVPFELLAALDTKPRRQYLNYEGKLIKTEETIFEPWG